MSSFTLLNTSADLFRKLLADYHEYDSDPESTFKALNFATTAWHLTDWVWIEYEITKYSDIGAMRTAFALVCPELNVMHDLATGYKHFTVSRPKSGISGNYLHEGEYDPREFDRREWDTPCLMLDFNDGSSKSLDDFYDAVWAFWTQYFANHEIT